MAHPFEGERVSAARFKSLMRKIASSVAVVTTNREGVVHGMTATAVCSVSADPPSVLIVVNRANRSHPIITAAKAFTVNILAEDQDALGDRFAAKYDAPFDGVSHRLGLNACPILDRVAAYLECATIAEIDAETHTIFIGRVIAGDVAEAAPLLYHEGVYKYVSPRVAAPCSLRPPATTAA